MKTVFSVIAVLVVGIIAASCAGKSATPAESAEPVEREDLSGKTFDQLFTSVEAADLSGNVFELVGQDYTVITAGTIPDHNSMVASWGGWGIIFNKPATWCFLRASRYTLEVMRKSETYTMCYFPDVYKEDVMLFGAKSGRDSDKMKESKLSPVATPDGLPAYKEAKLIIECKLTEVTTVSKDDFYTDEGRDFVQGGFDEAGDWHKQVFGEITKIWVRK